MFEIVIFENGRYGARNEWTGNVLPNKKHTGAAQYRTKIGILRHIRRIDKELAKTLNQLQQRSSNV